MKILVIYAHPSGPGHCATILQEVKANLDEKKADYEILDLYALKYNPLLQESELFGRDIELKKDTIKYQEKVKAADLMIFIYPVWWNSMPAVMKGFFDRVFSSGFAFRYMPVIPKDMMPFFEKIFVIFKRRFDYGMPIGLLKEKKAIVFLTTGSPKYAGYPWHHFRYAKLIKYDILGFFGIKSRIYQLDNCRRIDDWKIAEIKKMVKCGLKNVK